MAEVTENSFSQVEFTGALKDLLTLSGLAPIDIQERNYWFLRTQGGEYFDEFRLQEYIAIDWDDVPCKVPEDRTEQLMDNLKVKYKQATRVLNQVLRFCTEMKKGDIVIIPSSGSSLLAFGKILEDDIYEYKLTDEEFEDNKCPYRRRRRVKWLTAGAKNMIDPKLFAFFRNQQALANANEYAEFIERAINPFYIKNGIAHLNLSVKIENSPKATDIPYYILGIVSRVDGLGKELSIAFPDVESRINVQSDGIIEFFGNPLTIFSIGLIVISLCGGDMSVCGFKLSTKGLPKLIDSIVSAYLKVDEASMIKKEKLAEIQERLKIEDPRDDK